MKTRALLTLLALPMTPVAADHERTFVEGVVTLHGSGTATCDPADELFCSGPATVTVVLAGPEHPGIAGTVPATLSIGNRWYFPPGGVSFDIEGRHVEATLYDNSCHGYGPDVSSGPGAGTIVIDRVGNDVEATFTCTAVLIERIL